MLCPILIHPFLLPSALKCVCVYWFFRDQSMNYFIIPYIVYLLYNWKTEAPCYWQEYIVLISSISPPTNQGIVCLHLRYCIFSQYSHSTHPRYLFGQYHHSSHSAKQHLCQHSHTIAQGYSQVADTPTIQGIVWQHSHSTSSSVNTATHPPKVLCSQYSHTSSLSQPHHKPPISINSIEIWDGWFDNHS